MRAIASVDPAGGHLDAAALARISADVEEWAEHSDKPLILMDGVSVELFDDDWNFVTRSPYWKSEPIVSTELLSAKVSPDWTVLGLLLVCIALQCVSILLWAYVR